MQHFLKKVNQALTLDPFDVFQAQTLMSPVGRPARRPQQQAGAARLGAVLLMLYERQQEVHIVFAKRPQTLKHHAGQVAFPGGRQEPQETFAQTALRETCEEIGICAEEIQLLGQLTPIYIPPSDFQVYPFVGWHSGEPRFTPSADEVELILEVPLAHFQNPQNRVLNEWIHPFFRVDEHKVWGGTAVMLNELVERLAAVQTPHTIN